MLHIEGRGTQRRGLASKPVEKQVPTCSPSQIPRFPLEEMVLPLSKGGGTSQESGCGGRGGGVLSVEVSVRAQGDVQVEMHRPPGGIPGLASLRAAKLAVISSNMDTYL